MRVGNRLKTALLVLGLRKLRDGLGRRSPFLWLVLTPLLTAPLSAVLIYRFAQELDAQSLGLPTTSILWDGPQATLYYYDFWPTWLLLTAAGLPNLLVALWFFHPNGYMKVAAGAALVMAVLRTFVVVLVFFAISQTNVISHNGELLMRIALEAKGLLGGPGDHSPEFAKMRMLLTLWLYGAYMWAACLALWGLWNLVMDRFLPHLKPPRKRQPGEPRAWGSFLERR